MVGLCSQMFCVSPAFPLQLSLPTPPTWNGSSSTSSWHLLIHLKVTIPSLPWSPIWSIFPDEVLFPFLHRQFVLVTDACTLCPWWHAWLPGLPVIRRLTACLPLDRSGWPSPDGSLPAARMNFHIWSCSFQKWKAWLSHPCRPSSNAHRNLGLPGPSTLTVRKMPHIPGPVVFAWLWIMQSLLKAGLHSSQTSLTQGPLNSCMCLCLPAVGHSVTAAERSSQSSTDSPTSHPPFKPQVPFYVFCKSFPMHATHRGLSLLEPQGICSLSHVEFSTFSFCLIICLFSTLALSFGLSGGYGLFSQLSCKRVGYRVTVSGLESALRSHPVTQSVQLWFRAQSRWSANISCWQPLFHTMQLEEKISRCFFCTIFLIS